MTTCLCLSCGSAFVRRPGRGRPRRYCPSCIPTYHAFYLRAWRIVNPLSVARSNAQRRVRHPLVTCAGCGYRFRAPRTDSLFCCDRCRDALRVNGHPKTGRWAEMHHELHSKRRTP